MARTIAQIKQSLIDEKNAQSSLSGLTSTSQTAIWNLIFYVCAVGIAILEQFMDVYKAEIQTIVNSNVAATAAWIQSKVFLFQYSATNPQVVQVSSDFTVSYPTVDEGLQIVTRCSVKSNTNKTVTVKVAKSEPPAALDSNEQIALNEYLTHLLPAGVEYQVQSLTSDKISITGTIYYDGQYADTIQENVEGVINTFLSQLPFDGFLFVQKLTDAIQAGSGVVDVKIDQIKARDNATVYASGSTVYDLAGGVNNRFYEPIAGYIVEETTSGFTFADTITYVAV